MSDTRLYVNVPAVAVGAETVAVLVVVETVRFAPPLMLYVKVNGAVPTFAVNVISGLAAFKQTPTVVPMLATGTSETSSIAKSLPVALVLLFQSPMLTQAADAVKR